MTIREKLEQIVDLETPHAEDGCAVAQGRVINAQADLEELDRMEWKLRASQWQDEDERNWRSEERNWGVEPEDA